MKLYKIVFVCLLVYLRLSSVPAGAEPLDEHYQMLTKPMVLEGTMFFMPNERIIEVRSGDVVKYYCQVTIEVDDLGAFREHFDQLRKFNSRIAITGWRNAIKVLSPASKIKRNGVEIFEPLEYKADKQSRKYLLLYCPAIALEEALPFLIAGSKKLE
jgi:hypothetical protein